MQGVTTLEEVREAAMALSADERELLAADLYCSLEKEPGYDEAWAAEIQRRIEEIDSGKVKMVPWERVRERLYAGVEADDAD
jgi:putative addiction module component (TIGR02574 family)